MPSVLWEPNGKLVLDIIVFSPSDAQNGFEYLTFEPDVPLSDYCYYQEVDQSAQPTSALAPALTEIIIGRLFDQSLDPCSDSNSRELEERVGRICDEYCTAIYIMTMSWKTNWTTFSTRSKQMKCEFMMGRKSSGGSSYQTWRS